MGCHGHDMIPITSPQSKVPVESSDFLACTDDSSMCAGVSVHQSCDS